MAGAALEVGILDEDDERKDSAHLTFRCPPELFERLELAKKATGWKRSKLIVRLVNFGLEALESELVHQKKSKK